MGSTPEQIGRGHADGDSWALDDQEKTSILRELESILGSPFYQTSKRSQQFLSYVVRHQLEGNHDRLKERTIGVDLFHRPVGYATGDDPVVRVQAGEVRRRLEQYYHTNPNHSPVRIELRPGSYAPQFRWAQPDLQQRDTAPAELHEKDALQGAIHRQEQPRPVRQVVEEIRRKPENRKSVGWRWMLASLAIVAGLVLVVASILRAKAPATVLEQFWSPTLSSSEPVLICMAKPSVYLPSLRLYQRHSKTPEKFLSQFERLTSRPNLQPNDRLEWGDMVEYPDYGLAAGDVYAAVRLSALLGKIGKMNQVRIGGNYSFEDLRNFPAVVIGAFNNRWTMQMTSNLHFGFAEEGGESIIREDGSAGRRWHSKTDSNGKAIEDFAVVTRLLNSKTGQFVVVVAGIKSYGTQAAGEFVSNSEGLEKALRTSPKDWNRKNLQIVIHTAVTDSVPGPPEVVATYVW